MHPTLDHHAVHPICIHVESYHVQSSRGFYIFFFVFTPAPDPPAALAFTPVLTFALIATSAIPIADIIATATRTVTTTTMNTPLMSNKTTTMTATANATTSAATPKTRTSTDNHRHYMFIHPVCLCVF